MDAVGARMTSIGKKMTRDIYEAATDEAHEHNLRVIGHVFDLDTPILEVFHFNYSQLSSTFSKS